MNKFLFCSRRDTISIAQNSIYTRQVMHKKIVSIRIGMFAHFW